jgi:hypothetical protein
MIAPRLLRHEDGVVFEDLAPFYVVVLMEVPELLAPDAPDEVKRRLYPMPSDDADAQEEWRRLVHPELFALIASARDIMRRDLSALEQRREPGAMPAWRVEIPAAHVEAWISGLNAARLALGARFGIESEADMHPEFDDGGPLDDDEEETTAEDDAANEEANARRIGVFKIHALAELQALAELVHIAKRKPEHQRQRQREQRQQP